METIVRFPDFNVHSLGVDIKLDLEECDPAILKDGWEIKKIMLQAATIAGATIVGDIFHNFNPCGTSGVVVIEESHLAIHTWPEYGSVAIDIFTCGDLRCDLAANYLYKILGAGKYSVEVRPRLISKKARPHKINL